MPWTLTVTALGVTVAIDGDELNDGQRAAVERAWADAACLPGHAADVTVVAEATVDTAALLSELSQRVTLAAIEAQRGRLWMLHAAGLALDDGRVVALVGPSGRGKTTAARVLGERFGYVSDETVGIDADGAVVSHRKPLSIIQGDGAVKAQCAPSELGLRALPEVSLRLAGIVVLERTADAGEEPEVEALDLGDALADLVEQSSYLPDLPTPLRSIARLVQRAGVWRVRYREATQLIDVLPQIATGATDAAVPPITDVAGLADPRDDVAVDEPAYFRAPVRDSVRLDDPDRIAILQIGPEGEGMVRVLAGVAPAVWRAATGAPFGELVSAAVDAYGDPGGQDANALVSAAVAELVAAGILEHRPPRWRIRDDVAWTDSGDRVVVLPLAVLEDPQPLILEGSARDIWFALQSPGSIADVTRRVSEMRGVEGHPIEADVAAFVGSLSSVSLVDTPDRGSRVQSVTLPGAVTEPLLP